MNKQLHIGYFADGPWAHQAFLKIISDETLSIDFVCVRNDKRDAILIEMAGKYGIDVLNSPNINSKEFISHLKAYPSDMYVSMSFNQIFKEEIINLTKYKIINCHAGKLPFYRGRNILNWVLINDEKEFGITVHYVDQGIDTGDIILQRSYPITDSDDYSTLLDRAYEGCSAILYEAIKKIQAGTADRIQQNTICPVGMYCGIRKEGDELLDWNQTSREIFNFVRAICRPGPEARTYINGSEVKINRVEMIPDAPVYKGIPGQILMKDAEGVIVKSKDSFVVLKEYSSDVKLKAGDRLSN